MNQVEQGIFNLITEAETIVPVFLHSPQAIVAFNVSEDLLNAVLNFQKTKTTTVVTPSTKVVPATA